MGLEKKPSPDHPEAGARLSHLVWRMGKTRRVPTLGMEHWNDIVDLNLHQLPSVSEQADNMIVALGEEVSGPGNWAHISCMEWKARVGVKDSDGVSFIVKSLIDRGLAEGNVYSEDDARATLSFDGWNYLEELKRGQHESHLAFFASKWGEVDLNAMYVKVFTPAVKQTGFRLIKLDDRPAAGLIDDRLRVEIRNSRFLIADLTHDNNGAYWEAGYAEGLGKPVIYVCEKSKFEAEKSHFDTNHHLTVIWDSEDPVGTAERLKATIRATLPDQAKMDDEGE